MMRISFIRPDLMEQRSSDAMEPLAFAVLKALSPPDIEFRLWDDRIERVPLDEPADLAAITVDTFAARRAYQLASAFRARGVPVVLGGHHPSALPEEALDHADSVVAGDAETVWTGLLEEAREGKLKRIYRGEPSIIPPGRLPDRSIFKGKRYAGLALTQAGRGCPYACDFCSLPVFYGPRIRYRPLKEVLSELEPLRGRRVFFVDDNLFADRAQAEALLRALIPLRLRWICQAAVDAAADPRLLDLMAESGCIGATMGFESLDKGNLEQMRKAANLRQADYGAVVSAFHERGIMVCATFVFGYDRDTEESFDPVLEFALRSRVCLANFNPLTPMPGTPLYRRLAGEGRLLFERWWMDPAYRYGDAVFRPKRMSPEALTEGCFRLRREFNTFGSILMRGLNRQANTSSLRQAGFYLAANLVSRREIFRKQGSPLGGRPEPAAVPAP